MRKLSRNGILLIIISLFPILMLLYQGCTSLSFLPEKYRLTSEEYVLRQMGERDRKLLSQKRQIEQLQQELDSLRQSLAQQKKELEKEVSPLSSDLVILKKRSEQLQNQLQSIKAQLDSTIKRIPPLPGRSYNLDSLEMSLTAINISDSMVSNNSLKAAWNNTFRHIYNSIITLNMRIDTVYHDLNIVEDSFMSLLKLQGEYLNNNLGQRLNGILSSITRLDTIVREQQSRLDTLAITHDSLYAQFQTVKTVLDSFSMGLVNLDSVIKKLKNNSIRIDSLLSQRLGKIEEDLRKSQLKTLQELDQILRDYLDRKLSPDSSITSNWNKAIDSTQIKQEQVPPQEQP